MQNLDPQLGTVGYWIKNKREKLLAFVYADFSLQSRLHASNPLYAFGQGRAYPSVLGAAERLTTEIRNRFKDITIIWVLHFAPFDCVTSLRLIDWKSVAVAAARLNILCTLCGHTHDQTKTTINGHTIYCAGSAGCVDSEANSRVHVLEFELDSNVRLKRRNFVWKDSDHDFIEDEND
jgi:hypothetical protein